MSLAGFFRQALADGVLPSSVAFQDQPLVFACFNSEDDPLPPEVILHVCHQLGPGGKLRFQLRSVAVHNRHDAVEGSDPLV